MAFSGENPTALFEKAWNLYEAIAIGNHMSHREIYALVAKRLSQLYVKGGYRMLDLGCGDTRFLEPCFSFSRPALYQGVDLSEAALGLARKRLDYLGKTSWAKQDLLEYMKHDTGKYDVIFSGYAVHHLSTASKTELFATASNHLEPGGCFMLVDVIREPEQTREDYIIAYLSQIRNNWPGLTAEMVDEACAHVAAFDFPEGLETLDLLAQRAGFQKGIVHAKFGPHAFIEFPFSSGSL
jgi:cyclopropane fatty-acyl-phospholipid synthase-like methyltransferase